MSKSRSIIYLVLLVLVLVRYLFLHDGRMRYDAAMFNYPFFSMQDVLYCTVLEGKEFEKFFVRTFHIGEMPQVASRGTR